MNPNHPTLQKKKEVSFTKYANLDNIVPVPVPAQLSDSGQLQQLFHLHDSGVDQSYIDTLPVFVYKAIIGLKNPFDCAVCLSEFEPDDKLRLLPKCSHAFHIACIDTWLLSHSTCPLCRGSLIPEFPYNSSCSPIVLVLESGSESSREIVSDRHVSIGIGNNNADGTNFGCHGEYELGLSSNNLSHKASEVDPQPTLVSPVLKEKIVPVKLGKFRNVDNVSVADGIEGGSSSSSNVDARRCFSMGSYEYVMNETLTLQVAIRPSAKKQNSKKPSLPLMPGHRPARSECDCHSSREFKGFDGAINGIGKSKRDSFSISKIWLQSKKDKPESVGNTSRRAFSFRFPFHQNEAAAPDDLKSKDNNSSTRTFSEMDFSRWGENCVSELGVDDETRSCGSLDSQSNLPSFARRTLLWLAGRQNKVVHSSSSPNV
ncbi:hypothetical protein GIB67_031514 [Kingdonia uniflora]|uniref:RING-type E3 ubiquitin transferase n=1 Tax=Kingdonia uniflora TaxID=39325 RepID=A0A7J7MNB4_9MAGN|nr:hypothetical protein GIB67_031514 [Kingdonia uniflora]